MRILVADDSSFMRRIIRTNLEKLGHHVVAEASNGIEAVEKYQEFNPDVVFIDMVMPVMGGLDAIASIHNFNHDAIVIMCSSMGHTSFIKEAIMKGARDFIVKPFTFEKIEEALSKLDNVHDNGNTDS